MATRHIHVIGIGAGDPEYVTVQAIEALNKIQVFFAMDKGEAKSDLVGLRRDICARFIREPGYRFVELPDPRRSTDSDYREAVSDWHAARARIWATAIATELGPDGVGAFLAWGDPSLYDSTLRILDAVSAEIDVSYDVIPGITAIQALTARHRIPLNDAASRGHHAGAATSSPAGAPASASAGRSVARRPAFVSMLPARTGSVGRLPRHRRRAARRRHDRRGWGAHRRVAGRRPCRSRLDYGHLFIAIRGVGSAPWDHFSFAPR